MAALNFPASPTIGDTYEPSGLGIVYTWDGTTWLSGASAIIRFYGSLDGKPDPGMELFDIEMIGDEVFTASLPSNLGSCDVAATGTVQFPILVNGVQVGYAQVAAASTTMTWSMASDYVAAAGDRLKFAAPSSQDATLSGPRWTLVGRRV